MYANKNLHTSSALRVLEPFQNCLLFLYTLYTVITRIIIKILTPYLREAFIQGRSLLQLNIQSKKLTIKFMSLKVKYKYIWNCSLSYISLSYINDQRSFYFNFTFFFVV